MNMLLSTAVAATLLGASAVPAPAQPAPQAPISISSCTLSAPPRLFEEGVQADAGGLQITFVNRADATATGIRFLVRIGRTEQTIDDTGRFASGIAIAQAFAPAAASYGIADAACEVESVTFADGTTWQR
jgi:hypothetical protein